MLRETSRVVIVGASIGGVTACETLRALGCRARISVVSEEGVPTYSRCLLPDYLAGRLSKGELGFRGRGWARALEVEVVRERAEGLDPAAQEVVTASGRRLGYDRLLIVSGAVPLLPPIPGIGARGVHDLYWLRSAEAVARAARACNRVLVLGGGLIGSRAAEAFRFLGKEVALIARHQVLPRMVDEAVASRMEELLEAEGVRVYTNSVISEVLASKGRMWGVRLGSGEVLEGELLLCATGTRPRTELAQGAGLALGRGIKVDAHMATSVENVYAAGDVVEFAELGSTEPMHYANWWNAAKEARVAAQNMAGVVARYEGRLKANALELFGLPIVSVGSFLREGIAREAGSGRGYSYTKFVFEDERLVGVLAVGDISRVGQFAGFIQQSRPTPGLREAVSREGLKVPPTAELLAAIQSTWVSRLG